MGLLDSVIGSVVGSSQGSSSSSSSPMSPMVKALMLLLAAKAASSYMSGSSATQSSAGTPSPGGAAPHPSDREAGTIQSGILKGFPSLDSILDRFTRSGHEDKVQSWIGPGENRPIQPHELQQALGPEQIDHLQRETGLPRDQLLRELSRVLPQVVDKLTPHGRMPTSEERSRW